MNLARTIKQYVEQHKAKAHTREKLSLFSVDAQEAILRDMCGKEGLRYEWFMPFPPDITPFSHTVVVTLSIYEGDSLKARGLGASTRYSWEYVTLAKSAATEAALTVAKGKALCDLGFNPENDLKTAEEVDTWKRMQGLEVNNELAPLALAFSLMNEDIKHEAVKQGLSIEHFVGLYDPDKHNHTDMERMITDGIALEYIKTNITI